MGIYTAKHPAFSVFYTDSDLMFVCLGLIGPRVKTITQTREICVFFEDELVVPMWVVQFDSIASPEKVPKRVLLPELIGKSASCEASSIAIAASSGAAAAVAKRPLTKRMIKQAPREIKEFYRQGVLRQKK